MGSSLDRIKGIAKSLMSPGGTSEFAVYLMQKRIKKLYILGGKKTGGMFDIIYKGRKAREDALGDID